jgi:uncharacterized protein (TIGR03437 family)
MRVQSLSITFLCAATAAAQMVGPSVNMVTGTGWPDGDPFLQRQNEPSMAVSSRNPLHLLAGANDYRTVDLPNLTENPDVGAGDAWLGVFRSTDGGQTWKSTLLPGYPQDRNETGKSSPLKVMTAGADPVVRAGTNGLFYFGGIAFERSGANRSRVFLARFIDDNTSAADPIRYLSTSVVKEGDATHFEDKPAFASDIPRKGAAICKIPSIPEQSFPGGRVYAAWSEFTPGPNSSDSRILFSHSDDCGATWSEAKQISGTNKTNQAASIAINQYTGAVYVVWRAFAVRGTKETDAILFTQSSDGGANFSAPQTIADINPFDQGTSGFAFRTKSYPTIAVDGEGPFVNGVGTIFVAWSQKGTGPGGDARIVVSSSSTSLTSGALPWQCAFGMPANLCASSGEVWSKPSPINNPPGRGHQFMPSLIFSNGKLTAAWYDHRDTGTLTLYGPINGVAGQYKETQVPPRTGVVPQFDGTVADSKAHVLRHTLDVRVAQSADRTAGPAFPASVRASEYAYGTRPNDAGLIKQLEVNPPNLPMFKMGSVPFVGDYIDLAGQTFVLNADGSWRFNTLTSDPEHIHATWTDNRNVIQPRDGNWSNYTPIALRSGVTSKFDPSQTLNPCAVGQAGIRNQDIYTSRISSGLVLSSKSVPGPLSPDQQSQRTFPVNVQNTTGDPHSYRLNIAKQPVGGKAAFLQFATSGLPDPYTQITIAVPPYSSVSRSVFITSTDPAAALAVDVSEVDANGGALPNGSRGTIVLNRDFRPTSNIATLFGKETFFPVVSAPDLSNPDLSNPDLSNPDLSNPDLSNPDLSNPDLSNIRIANPDLSNPDLSNPDLSNAAFANPDLSNPDLSNKEVAASAINDATWALTNRGNTAGSYSLKLLKNQPVPTGVTLQLIASKRYNTPAADGCTLKVEPHYVVLLNQANPVLTENAADLAAVDFSKASVSIGPGETIALTVRAFDSGVPGRDPLLARARYNPATAVTPVAVPDAANTGNTVPSLPLTIATTSIPAVPIGQSYTQALGAMGGAPPYAWSLAAGTSLLPGLTFRPDGSIIGTPVGAGSVDFMALVTDATGAMASKLLTLAVTGLPSNVKIATASPVAGAVAGVPYALKLAASGGSGTLTWADISKSLPGGLAFSDSGTIAGVATSSGLFRFTARVTDSNGGSDTRTLAFVVNPPPPQTPKPVIAAVVSAAPDKTEISSGSWVTIYGTGFAASARPWQGSDFSSNRLPVSLDGVSVKIDGSPAAVSYIGPTQINVLSPVIGKIGPVTVEVTNARGSSSATANAQTYAPAFFLFPQSFVAAVHADGTYVAKPGVFEPAGPRIRPAQPGETVQIFGTGFGPTNPVVDPGQLVARPASLKDPGLLRVLIGGMPVRVTFAGITGPGLYQLNVTIPEGMRPGDYVIVARIGDVATPSGTMISVGGPPPAGR